MIDSINNWLLDLGLGAEIAKAMRWIILGIGVFAVAWLSNWIAKKVLLVLVSRFVRRTKTTWDDALIQNRVFARIAHILPGIVFYSAAPLFPPVEDLVSRMAYIYLILVGLFVFNSFLNAIQKIYQGFAVSRHRPIKGYIQIIQIIATIMIAIVVIATMMNRQVWPLLTGLGAMTAIIILIFRDSILGLVASIQLSNNDMVRIGDWVEMPKYDADGDVIDVSLTTIKVQNWDKTITTIPAYAMIADSFKNWRGMQDSGGRRIKRSVNIDMSSIKFCTTEMLDRFEKYQLLTDYIKQRRKDIAEYNKKNKVDTSELINGRNMTNVGTFRAYIAAYLKAHPMIHDDMTFLIRHLQPDEKGLPIEIYVFSRDQRWANYEAIQADIFDHILAVVPLFDLRVFQNPTGMDFRMLSERK